MPTAQLRTRSLLALIMQVPLLATAQGFGVQWSRSYGSAYSDDGKFIAQRADGNYFIAGSSGNNDGDFSMVSGQGGGLLMLADSVGGMLWAKRIGGTSVDDLIDGCPAQDGGYVLVGRAHIDTVGLDPWDWKSDAWVVKVDSSGDIQWQHHYGTTQWNDMATSVSPTSDGGFYVAGEIYFGGSMDIWVMRLDPNGNELWQRYLGGSSADIIPHISTTFDQGAILTGSTYSNDGDITTGLNGVVDIWVVKLDGAGNMEWSNTYGSPGVDNGANIIPTSDGNYLLLGYVTSSGGDVSTVWGSGDAWVAKLDGTGGILWETTLGGSDQDELWGVIEIAGGYLLTGFTQSSDGNVTVQYGSGDAWQVVVNDAGDLIWEQTYGGTSWEYLWGTCITPNGPIMVGRSNSSDYLLSTNQGASDIWILKLGPATTTLGGLLFPDFDGDGEQGAFELGIPHRMVEVSTTGQLTITDEEGRYAVGVAGPGTFTTEAIDIPYYTKAPSSCSTTLDSLGEEVLDLDFRFLPMGEIIDLEVSIVPFSSFNPGFPVRYDVHCRNIGTSTMVPSLGLSVSPLLAIDSTTPPATTVYGNELHWDLGTLGPLQDIHVLVDATVTLDSTLGALVQTSALIGPLNNDNDTTNNRAVSIESTTGSYDPNAISVDPTTIPIEEVGATVLDYLIQFQNTGTDAAHTVRITNPLPLEVELQSFEFVGSSHPLEVRYIAYSREMEFLFNDILLPDSGANEIESHGYVRYRIKPLASLVIGDTISNLAAIYFDYNPPVITAPAITSVVETVGTPVDMTPEISLYPNPCRDLLTIQLQHAVQDGWITVVDLLGRNFFQGNMDGSMTAIDLDGFSSGCYMVQVNSDHDHLSARFIAQ